MAKFVEFTGAKKGELVLINVDRIREVFSIDVIDPDKSKGVQAEMPHARTVITFGIIPMEGQETMLVCEEYVVVKAMLTGE